jgi:hypothetical protein
LNASVYDSVFRPVAGTKYDNFLVGVAGDLVAFELRGEGPWLVEQVGPNTYLGFDGRAEASVATATVSTITASFEGFINYCGAKAETAPYYDGSPARAVTSAVCESKNHHLILTRR